MSQGFKLKFDEMQENNPAKSETSAPVANRERYAEAGQVRNVCFEWEDGNRIFLNYAYLVSVKYEPEENRLALHFTSDDVLLHGVRLESLFFELMQHLPKIISCKDARYNTLKDENASVVNQIVLIPKE